MTDLQRSTGAYTQLEQLVRYHGLARSISLKRNHKAIAQLSGQYKSPMRGRGMEFEDVRLYQAGDDIRSIDWRVTARTGDTYTKQFREEREQPVFIALDQQQSLFFGSQVAMKSVLACDLAAYIAWASLAKGDKVGGMIMHQPDSLVKPNAQRKTVLRFLQHCIDANHALGQGKTNSDFTWLGFLQNLRQQARPGSHIYLISDFYGLDEAASKELFQLAQHSSVHALFVYDELEQQLPSKGSYPVFNAFGRKTIQASSQQAAWQAYFDQRQASLKQLFNEAGCIFLPISTSDAPLDFLQRYLGAR